MVKRTTEELSNVIERAHLEIFGATAGVKLLDVVEGAPLFHYVEFPPGWKQIPSKDFPSWDDLIDDKGRKRATVRVVHVGGGYKCQVVPSNRFQASHIYNVEDGIVVGSVRDGGKLIYTTESIKCVVGDLSWLHVEQVAEAWLDKNYPDWRKYGAYWD